MTSKSPNWAWDELLLALELYFQIGVQSSRHPDVVALSETLNLLPIHTDRPHIEKFRNPNGVNLKLANFAALDPDYSGKGMAATAKLDKEVFGAFAGRREDLFEAAESIRAMVKNGDLPPQPVDREDEESSREGRLLLRRHSYRERDPKLVASKKTQVQAETGRLACEVCDFDFEEHYGALGAGFAECHHVIPLAQGAALRTTKLADLAILCSNCHRMIHRPRERTLSIADLRRLL